jgi:hypothetical protein
MDPGKQIHEKENLTHMRTIVLGSILFLLSLGAASAQIFSNVEFVTTTPFTAGNATVPAGRYIVRLTDDPSMLEIANPSGTISVLIEVEPMETYGTAKRTVITFNKYGERLVFKSVVVEGQENGVLSSTEMAERGHMRKYGKATKVQIPGTLAKDIS